MAIPDYQTCMLPLLQVLSDGRDRPVHQAYEAVAQHFGLTAEERAVMLPSGRAPLYRNRIAWAKTYLSKALLVTVPKRGTMRISDRGKALLATNPTKIDNKLLDQYPEFVEFRQVGGREAPTPAPVTGQPTAPAPIENKATPEESIETAYQSLRGQLSQELLSKVLECEPAFFEQLVVELLVKMGYGGSRADAGQRVGASGDGGIDGIIKEDRLGLDTIYIQAKRWQGSVGRPEIQKFVGALQGQRARKGVFITTSTFTVDAVDYASRIDTKVVLVDGRQLATYMIDFDVGVAPATAYVVKRIDSDYFEES